MYFNPSLTDDECTAWYYQRDINPRSNRKITKNGQVYKELKKQFRLMVMRKRVQGNHEDLLSLLPNVNNISPNYDKLTRDATKISQGSQTSSSQATQPLLKPKLRISEHSKQLLADSEYILPVRDRLSKRHIKASLSLDTQDSVVPKYEDSTSTIIITDKSSYIRGREEDVFCGIDTYDSIHENKFIMIQNKHCFDIEILVKSICSSFESGSPIREPGNIDPDRDCELSADADSPGDRIWYTKQDKRVLLSHPLIEDPSCAPGEWYYSKESFVSNCVTLRRILYQNEKDEKYMELFNRNLHLILNLNRLAFIFYTEQPSNHSSYAMANMVPMDGYSQEELDTIDVITEKIKMVLNRKYKVSEIDETEQLKSEVIFIFTSELMEEHYFSEITSMFSYDQKMDILVNAAISYGMSQNFRECVRAQHDMMKYVKSLPEHDRDLMLELLQPYLKTDECIHTKGCKMIQLFIRYWFMYLENIGLKRSDISIRYIPRVYGTMLNDKMELKSNLFMIENEDSKQGKKYMNRMNFFYKISDGVPYWLNKMGTDNTYAGINLVDYSFRRMYLPPMY